MSVNVTFSCNVLSRWAQLVTVFSRMFKFSQIVIYRAKSPRRGLEWGDLLILFSRNNCSLSVGVFSSSLICERIAVQFHGDPRAVSNLCSARGANSCGERFSILPRGQQKGRFFSRSAHFGNVSPFLVGATNTFSELIHPSSRHRLCCRTATSTIYTTFHYIHYISQRSNAKNCFRITGLQRQDSKQSADNNTRFSPSKPITECIKFTKRAELWTDFWQLDDIFEPPGRNELVVWKTDSRFFFLSPHTPVVARFARVSLLRHAFPISLLILRKKPTVLQSTDLVVKSTGVFHLRKVCGRFGGNVRRVENAGLHSFPFPSKNSKWRPRYGLWQLVKTRKWNARFKG